MFFKQKSNVLFRDYEAFGYLTDNRNFGYRRSNDTASYIGDKILSETGSVFISVLGKNTQSLDELAKKIAGKFTGADTETIKTDAKEFYGMLEQEGFVVSGTSIEECEQKDVRFSYKMKNKEISDDNYTAEYTHSQRDTQDFLEEFFEGKPQLTNLHIEITSKCNERCIHCYIPHDDKITNISADLFYDILDQCKDLRLLHLTLSGGEPMLHRKFKDFLTKCREYDFSVNVLSNLTLINDGIIEEMKANPLLGVQVSLYSMNPDIHDQITQMKGSFVKTKAAILQLIENDIPMQISCPIMKQNKDCYGDVVNWAKERNIHVGNDYGIIGQYNNTNQNLDCRLSIDEIKTIMADKIVGDPNYLQKIETDANNKKDRTLNDYICSVCHSSICITENGEVYPCAGWQGYIVGDIKETSLNEIWVNSKEVQYLRGLRRKDFPKCLKCVDKDYCTMCMVRNSNEHPQGDPLAINEHFCSIAKLNKQVILDWKNKSKDHN